MNISWIITASIEAVKIRFRMLTFVIAAIIISSISQQLFAQDKFIGIGYSSSAYSYSDSAGDAANAESLSATTSSDEENGIDFYAINLPDMGNGLGYEFGGQTYAFDYTYVDADNDTLTKELTGSVIYFNSLYSFEISTSAKLFAKAGVNFSPSSLSITTSSSLSGEGDDASVGIGFGAGLLFSPPSSDLGFLVKYDNFGTVVEDYENDNVFWTADGKFVSSGDLDLSSLTIAFAYRL